jgi:hypothetical protein
MIPDFDAEGLSPPGDYGVSFEELRRSTLIMGGAQHRENWGAAWRAQLVGNFEILARQLWSVGIRDIYADGSFVEDKDHPNDIDGYFVCDLQPLITDELVRELNLLDNRKYGRGTLRRAGLIGAVPKSNCPCGISTEWNCTHMCRD